MFGNNKMKIKTTEQIRESCNYIYDLTHKLTKGDEKVLSEKWVNYNSIKKKLKELSH